MLQNARVTAFTVSEYLKENQREGGDGGVNLPYPIQIKLNGENMFKFLYCAIIRSLTIFSSINQFT